MGGIYPRGNILWCWWFDASGKRIPKSTGLPVGQEKEALRTLSAIERRVAAEVEHAPEDRQGPPTVGSYGTKFFAARIKAGIDIAKIEAGRFATYIKPFKVAGAPFEAMPLADVEPHHVRDFVLHLRALEPQLAPRTIRAIFGQLRLMFRSAVVKGLVSASPCILEKGDLPKKVDKDPTWRSRAKFTRTEVEMLLCDERIPLCRRVRYAGLFLTGMRIGELAARRFRDADMAAEPLGRLVVETSYNRKQKREKSVKTERPREVPIHPTLARVLAAWKLSGWAATFGRQPGPDDLIWPSATLGHLRDTVVLREFHEDCEMLGLRTRRIHDTRRTFISLARGNGADKDTLRQVTHQPEGDQIDDYTTLEWDALCAEVSKLKIQLLDGKLLALPVAANAGGNVELLQSLLQSKPKGRQPMGIVGGIGAFENGRGGTRTLIGREQEETTKDKRRKVSGVSPEPEDTENQGVPADRSSVAAALFTARLSWIEDGSRRALRKSLLALLSDLDDAEGGR